MVASGDDGKVRIYNPELNVVGTVDGLDDADNVRLDPQGKLAYVGYADGAIAIIDAQQPRKIGEIKLDGHPEAFQLEEQRQAHLRERSHGETGGRDRPRKADGHRKVAGSRCRSQLPDGAG